MHLRKGLGTIAYFAVLIVAGCGGQQEKSPNVREAEKIVAEQRASGPLADGAFKASITTTGPPSKMRPGERTTLTVKVRNSGNAPWPAHGRTGDGYYQVNLGDNWFDSRNKRLEKHPYVRSALPKDVRPGEEIEVPLTITAPSTAGEYTLQVDLVQEMVAWFSDKGNSSPKFKVHVGD